MARRRHNDRTLYVVTWKTAGIIKIGFTDHLRRRLKTLAEATVVLALTFPDSLAGCDFEIEANRAAFHAWSRAFTSRKESFPFLGPFGGGYLECYRATPGQALDLIASQCYVTVSRHDVSKYRDATSERHSVTSRSYGRTDGLTETSGFRDGKKFRYVTRRRARRIFGLAAIGRAS